MKNWLEWLKFIAGGGAAAPATLAAFVALQACAVDQATGTAEDPIFATAQGALSTWTQLYFGQQAQAGGAPGQKSVEYRFDAAKGGTLLLQVSAQPKSSIEVKLYKQSSTGWSLTKSAVSKSGATELSLTPSVGGTYRAIVLTNPWPQTATAKLSCSAGTCTVGGQIGAGCGSRGMGPCAPGLFCNYQPGALCGMADAPGTCAQKPEICLMVYKPVCGCNGKTYGNSCSAAAAGVGVMSTGACCTDKAFAPKAIVVDQLAGGWDDLNDGKYPSTYTFAANGTFSRSDAVSPCPPGAVCIWSGIVTTAGTWKLNGATVALTWTKPQAANWGLLFPASLTASAKCSSWRLTENGGAGETFAK